MIPECESSIRVRLPRWRNRVREKVGKKSVKDAERHYGSGATDLWDGSPVEDFKKAQKSNGMPREGSSDPNATTTNLSQNNSEIQVSGSLTTSP